MDEWEIPKPNTLGVYPLSPGDAALMIENAIAGLRAWMLTRDDVDGLIALRNMDDHATAVLIIMYLTLRGIHLREDKRG